MIFLLLTGQYKVLSEKNIPRLLVGNGAYWLMILKFDQLIFIMHIIRRIEQILTNLRPVFSRHATYEWFVILIWGILLCSQHRAVTSYLNAVGVTQNYYTQALHMCHSKGISVQKSSIGWHKWLITHPKVYRLRGQPVYLGDGIKVGKEGRKMPAVKKLH